VRFVSRVGSSGPVRCRCWVIGLSLLEEVLIHTYLEETVLPKDNVVLPRWPGREARSGPTGGSQGHIGEQSTWEAAWT
jgi:hypothetical protein